MSKTNSSKLHITGGNSRTLGAIRDEEGVNFAVFSAHASRIELCLFSADGRHEISRAMLPEKTGSIWHGYVPGLTSGSLYGYRAHGSYSPEQGHRFNPNKLLMDPYTRELHGSWKHNNITLGYDNSNPALDLSFDERDSAHYVPKSVVSCPRLLTNLADSTVSYDNASVIYEAHVKGLTQNHPGVPKSVRGTYDGLASDAVLEHLQKLNITAIELLPVHAFVDDGFLVDRALKNYWGYNTIGFFAPEPRYFGPQGLFGFRAMVKKFQSAGIDVILDVVYNHTAEGDHRGPTLCYRGLDNASYYRLSAGQPRYYVNDTGCGNTLNVSHPYVLRMVLDSLRFWVQCMGVNGFRFDLATTIGREDYGFDPNGGFFDALRQDPVLSGVRLIAEPWDIGPGGYRLGEFPPEFLEWNDTYRDTVRRYWRGDTHSAQELGAQLLGSADRFDQSGRSARSSLNFVSSHDGFTLADITSYNERHNESNTENNKDGHNANFSDNGGVEGETDDPQILAHRSNKRRVLLATLYLSQGTPMLLAGDEIANSQGGNNNAYCQDNETGWVSWQTADQQLLDFVAKLSTFRAAHKSLSQNRFLHGEVRQADQKLDVEWTDLSGLPMQWRDPGLSCLCLTVRCSANTPAFEADDDVVFMVFNRDETPASVTVPSIADGCTWQCCIDTAKPDTDAWPIDGTLIDVSGNSVVALSLKATVESDDGHR